MTIEDNVEAGDAAKAVFGQAVDEAAGLGEEKSKHFWKRLARLIADIQKPPRAPATKHINDEESRKIGKMSFTKGKHGPNGDRKTIDEVPMNYLEWVADTWTDSFGDQVRNYLESPRIISERR